MSGYKHKKTLRWISLQEYESFSLKEKLNYRKLNAMEAYLNRVHNRSVILC